MFRSTDPETSAEGARFAAARIREDHHRRILDALRRNPGRAMAAEEIGDADGTIDHVQIGKRLCELQRGGLIERTTEKHRNRSGVRAFRYRLAGEAPR